jgi:hypothetical protein
MSMVERTQKCLGKLARLDAALHHRDAAGLPVIYHGCGNVSLIFDDFIEMGLESCNPLEAKSGLDVVELRRRYGHRMGFRGNMDGEFDAP